MKDFSMILPDRPGALADAGVNIEVLYSGHDNQLILVVDDLKRGRAVSQRWACDSAV